MTRILPATDDALRTAIDELRAGGVVAFPTETVYGLGARADDPDAIAAIYRVKGRPQDNPLIVHVADGDVDGIVAVWPDVARRLTDAFWPGALTLVARRHVEFPDTVSAGLDTVAVRCPDHAVARALIAGAGPLAAPSANRSGRPSPTTAQHVVDDLGTSIPYVVDGGPCRHGLESTVVDVTVDPPLVLRPGAIGVDALRDVAGAIDLHPTVDAPEDDTDARAPGMRHRHYSPRAELTLLDGDPTRAAERLRDELAQDPDAHGVAIGPVDSPRVHVFENATDLAHELYATLRHLDHAAVPRLFVIAPVATDATRALRNRLRKAASRRIEV